MRKIIKKTIVFIFSVLIMNPVLFSQVQEIRNVQEMNREIKNEKIFDDAFEGNWENSSRKITFNSSDGTVKIRLKNYYGKNIDQEYELDGKTVSLLFKDANKPFVQDGKLYFDYCRAWESDKNLFLPCCNIQKILLCSQISDENLYAYYFYEGQKNSAIKIRFWKFSIEPGEEDRFDVTEKVEFSVGEEKKECPKFIKIGTQLYTCVRGRGKTIRNVEHIEIKKLFPDFSLTKENGVDVIILEKPYLRAADFSDGQ